MAPSTLGPFFLQRAGRDAELVGVGADLGVEGDPVVAQLAVLAHVGRVPAGQEVLLGREPFDAEIRRALEAQNPGASFDWQKFISTPIPPVEVEHWRDQFRVDGYIQLFLHYITKRGPHYPALVFDGRDGLGDFYPTRRRKKA